MALGLSAGRSEDKAQTLPTTAPYSFRRFCDALKSACESRVKNSFSKGSQSPAS